jgi:hypothetical protein
MMRTAFSPADELQRVAEILAKYWVLALPTAVASLLLVALVVVSVLSMIATVLVGHAAAGHVGTGLGLGSGVLVGSVLFSLGLFVAYLAQAMTIAAAPAAFEGRPPNLGAALGLTIARLPQLLVAAAATFALALIPLALSIVVVGIPLLIVLGYFLMFVPAAVIVGNEGGIRAIKTSFAMTTQRPGECIICWLGTILALVAGVIANGIAVHLPVINLIAGFVIGGFTSAYAALLTVRFYLAIRDGLTLPVQQPPAAAAAIGGPPTIAG